MIPPGIASLHDYEKVARTRLDEKVWAFISGGSADEITMRRNRDAFDAILLESRVLRDMAGISCETEVLGMKLPFPALVAPTAFHKLLHEAGEVATVAGAAMVNAPLIVSTQSSVLLEEISAAAKAPLLFQLYIQPDREFTKALVERVETAGYRALVVTVDVPVSLRDQQRRSGFSLPKGISAVNLAGMSRSSGSGDSSLGNSIFKQFLVGAPTWPDISELVKSTRLPVIVKGIMSPDDARAAIDHGASAVVVSNHGGRSLDTLPATIEALPRIASAVAGRVPLLMDGGIRRGTDILKALALGAQAVLIGRPCLFGLAVSGAHGVGDVLRMLRMEFEAAMILTGCVSIADIGKEIIWQR